MKVSRFAFYGNVELCRTSLSILAAGKFFTQRSHGWNSSFVTVVGRAIWPPNHAVVVRAWHQCALYNVSSEAWHKARCRPDATRWRSINSGTRRREVNSFEIKAYGLEIHLP